MSNFYTISPEKLTAVIQSYNEIVDGNLSERKVKSYICADWTEGDEHQQWIDNAPAEEIADWLRFVIPDAE